MKIEPFIMEPMREEEEINNQFEHSFVAGDNFKPTKNMS
jgi:hypothetical protein